MGNNTYNCVLSNHFLTQEEQIIFKEYIECQGLDNGIWEVFTSLFNSSTKYTKPSLLKVFHNTEIVGVAILIRCTRYGKALFKNRILSGIMDLLGIPFYLWIRFGACMDMMSNPGFVKNEEISGEVFDAMVSFLKQNTFLTIINDYTKHFSKYPHSAILPALPHAIIDTSEMYKIQDYTKAHKNIKRKIRVFKNKGGEYTRFDHMLNEKQILSLKKCFISTANQSVFYLPYQDLYLKAAQNTSSTIIEKVHYFVATINGEFAGYQAALQTGHFLNALHGAFDRDRNSTFHAYDILFVKMTEFAIENKLKFIDYGAVLNHTKQKMVNKTINMSYFILSKYSIIQRLFNVFLKWTKIQGTDQLQFRNFTKN